jgi:cell division protein FtsB
MRRKTTTQRSGPGRSRRVKIGLLLLFLAFLFLAFGRTEDGLPQLWGKWRELDAAEDYLAQLQAENDSLRQVLWRLENDLDYVEKVAREEYGMVKEGEKVYRLQSPASGE